MVGRSFPCCTIQDGLLEKLAATIAEDRLVWAPRQSEDGVCRLQVINAALPDHAAIARLPCKKLLFPHRETVWSFHNGQYRDVDMPQPIAIVGLPLCDLQALWYLDQVFVEDAHYRQRRSRLFVAGAVCEPGPECRCDAALMPVAGDLVIGHDQVWALSESGVELLMALACQMRDGCSLPWPEGPAEKRRTITAEDLHAHRHAGIWTAEGDRCLSCGACSAVCPTCYCFDLSDVAEVNGSVNRQRLWDNCFFTEHGSVAGGFDFRAGRAARLRFRMEHKRLGFGELRGMDACVGCGRCRNVCPVDIDLDRIAAQLVTEGTDV